MGAGRRVGLGGMRTAEGEGEGLGTGLPLVGCCPRKPGEGSGVRVEEEVLEGLPGAFPHGAEDAHGEALRRRRQGEPPGKVSQEGTDLLQALLHPFQGFVPCQPGGDFPEEVFRLDAVDPAVTGVLGPGPSPFLASVGIHLPDVPAHGRENLQLPASALDPEHRLPPGDMPTFRGHSETVGGADEADHQRMDAQEQAAVGEEPDPGEGMGLEISVLRQPASRFRGGKGIGEVGLHSLPAHLGPLHEEVVEEEAGGSTPQEEGGQHFPLLYTRVPRGGKGVFHPPLNFNLGKFCAPTKGWRPSAPRTPQSPAEVRGYPTGTRAKTSSGEGIPTTSPTWASWNAPTKTPPRPRATACNRRFSTAAPTSMCT